GKQVKCFAKSDICTGVSASDGSSGRPFERDSEFTDCFNCFGRHGGFAFFDSSETSFERYVLCIEAHSIKNMEDGVHDFWPDAVAWNNADFVFSHVYLKSWQKSGHIGL